MNIDDLSKQLEQIHKENRQDHRTIFTKLDEGIQERNVLKIELEKRPSRDDLEQKIESIKAVVQANHNTEKRNAGIGGIIGGFIAFVVYLGSKLVFWKD